MFVLPVVLNTRRPLALISQIFYMEHENSSQTSSNAKKFDY